MLLAATVFGAVAAHAASAPPPSPLPIPRAVYRRLEQQPGALEQFLAQRPPARPAPAFVPPANSPWTQLTNQPPFNAGQMLQLTDGTLMVADQGPTNAGSSGWWRFSPDANGSYINGTWSQLASLPSGYAPEITASAVLPDGRAVIEGGEVNNGSYAWTNLGAIYDPLADAWTAIAAPSGWSQIGDGASTVLANGTLMLGGCCNWQQALLNPKTLTWTFTGAGKADSPDEEGWSLLPDGSVLTVDTNNTANLTNSERYTPATGGWTSAGSTIVKLDDTNGDGSGSHEIGPQLLRPNGTVFATGATGHTAVYATRTRQWTAGPDFPVIGGQQYAIADGPAAILPSGRVLMAASPGVYKTPTHFFVFDGKTLTQVADTANASVLSDYSGLMIVLPTGQVMFNSRLGDVEIYSEAATAPAAWAPVITAVPTALVAGQTYTLSGKQLNGLTQGAAYGDEFQAATNYPLVRIVNNATGHVFYARTFNHSRMAVAASVASLTHFTVPTGIETGASHLVVVANGIASAPVQVMVGAAARD